MQDKSAAATALALKCIYCLRTVGIEFSRNASDDMKAARSYMNHAIDRDDCCLLATIAAALYFLQTRDYFKAIKAYQMAIYSIPFSPLSP